MNQNTRLISLLFMTCIFSLTGAFHAYGQDVVTTDSTKSNVVWRVGTDVLSLFRSHQGINTQLSREKNNRITGLSLDLYFNLLDDHYLVDNLLFVHGTNFQLGLQQKFIRPPKASNGSRTYIGFELSYSNTTYQGKKKLCYSNGIYENDSNKCTGTSVPGIIFNTSRLKHLITFGKRYEIRKNMIFDMGMAVGFSNYWSKTLFDEYTALNPPGGGTFFGLPFSFGEPLSNTLGNSIEKLWNHTLLDPEEKGIAIILQLRLALEFQVNSRGSGK